MEYLAIPYWRARAFRIARNGKGRRWSSGGPFWRSEILELLLPGLWPWAGSEKDARTVAVLSVGSPDFGHVPMALFRRPVGGDVSTIEARCTSRVLIVNNTREFAWDKLEFVKEMGE